MAKRRRVPRSFTLPDDFIEDLQHAARIRDVSASQLVQAWCTRELKVDDYIDRLLQPGEVLDREDEFAAKADHTIRYYVDLIVNPSDPDDAIEAHGQLYEYLAENTSNGRLS